jgi:glycosyltransferase involved in cell wall biosynthesis
MDITIVQGPYYPVPPLLGGAVEKAWFDLGREFARRGHRVLHVSRKFVGLAARETIEGVDHVRVEGFTAPKSKLLYRMLDLIYSMRVLSMLPPAQVVVTNTIWLPILIRDSRYGALYVHVGRYPKGQMRLYRHAARLQTVSAAVASAIARETPLCAHKIRVIPYPVLQVVDPTNLVNSWKDREKTILYVGRIHPEKGLGILFEAFARLVESTDTQWHLTVIGPWETNLGGGGKRHYESLRKVAAGLDGKINWVDPVFERHLLDAFYRQASLFCYPSIAETGESLGLAPLEAMALGCPAVVSALPCFNDYVVDGQTGFIFNHRAADPVAELAQKLVYITSRPDNLAQVAAQACRTAARYLLPAVGQEFLNDFATLAYEASSAKRLRPCV